MRLVCFSRLSDQLGERKLGELKGPALKVAGSVQGARQDAAGTAAGMAGAGGDTRCLHQVSAPAVILVRISPARVMNSHSGPAGFSIDA